MGPDDYVIALYAVSGTLAMGCAFLPGAGPVGRCANILTSALLLLWTANIYLRDGWYSVHPAMLLIPGTMLAYAMFTIQRQHHREQAEWFSPVYRGEQERYQQLLNGDRRGASRVPLPGEYDHTPIGEAPPPHDPWAALYASAEREQLRGGAGRHRPTSQLANSGRFESAVSLSRNANADTLTDLAACQTAVAATEAAYQLWQTDGPAEPTLT